MHKNTTKCNETLSKWCKNKHGASKNIDTFETYHMVAQKIDLKEKRVHALNPMIQEPFFSLPVVPTPAILEVVVQVPVATPPMTTRCEDSEPDYQEPTELFVEHERELQLPPLIDVPEVEVQNEPKNEAL
jgi:hypothetical protein